MSDKEKLEKILEMMHPGYWSAYDYRRDAILDILEVDRDRMRWASENPFAYQGEIV